MALPVLFRIDVKGAYIPAMDEAWDWDKHEKEEKKNSKKKKKSQDFDDLLPMDKYFAGMTRYDISAPGLKDYLDLKKNPAIFRFRRLKFNEHETLKSKEDLGDSREAQRMALMFALEGIDNVDIKLDGLGTKILDIDQVEDLADVIGRETIWEIGRAIIRASGDLRDWEKKR